MKLKYRLSRVEDDKLSMNDCKRALSVPISYWSAVAIFVNARFKSSSASSRRAKLGLPGIIVTIGALCARYFENILLLGSVVSLKIGGLPNTAPLEKYSALRHAYANGSSKTKSTPADVAISALFHLFKIAAEPR